MISVLYEKELGVSVRLIFRDNGLYNQLIREGYMNFIDFITTKESISRFSAKSYNLQIIEGNIIQAIHSLLEKILRDFPH